MADQPGKPQPRKRRRWLRRLLYSFLLFFLLVVVFHRPIIHYGARWAAIWLAGKQHMSLDLRLKGNIWSRLEVHDLKIQARDTGKAPVESASMDRLVVEYDLWRLIKGDFAGLKLIDVGTAEAVITPALDVDPEPPQPFAMKVRAFLANPLPTPVVRVTRVDARVKQEGDDIVLRGLHARIDPGEPGVISWERIEIPGVPPIDAGTAQVLLTSERLAISDVTIWPEVRVTSAYAQRAHGDEPAEIGLDVALPEGSLTARANPVTGTEAFDVKVDLETQGIDDLAPRFGVTLPQMIDSASLEAEWRGVPEEAGNSSGSVKFSATGRKDLSYPGWTVSGEAKLDEETVTLKDTELRVADSVFSASGTFDASKTLAHTGPGKMPLPEGKLDFKLNAPDLEKAGAEFRQDLHGSANVTGTVTTTADTVNLDAAVTGTGVGQGDTTAGKVDAKISAKLPITDAPPLSELDADVTATVQDLKTGDITADRVELKGNLRDLQANVTELNVTRGENKIEATGSVQLKDTGEIAGAPSADFSIDAPSLRDFGFKVDKESIEGAATGSGTVTVKNGKISGDAKLTTKDLKVGQTQVGDADLTINADEGVTTAKGTVKRGDNTVDVDARAVVDEEGKLTESPSINFNINAPSLSDFEFNLGGVPFSGDLKSKGSISFVNGQPQGTMELTAEDLTIGEAEAGRVEAEVTAENGELKIKNLRAQFNDNDYLEASGSYDLKKPNDYSGSVALRVRDLAAFEEIAGAFGQERELGGSLELDWTGQGDAQMHSGKGDLTASDLKVDDLQIDQARISGSYDSERVNIPEFSVTADELQATAELEWINKRLHLRALEAELGGKPVLTGEASVPLDPFGKSVLPENEPISANIEARDLELARLFRELKMEPMAEGKLSATLTASGTLDDPVVKLDTSGRGMRLAPHPGEMTDEQRAVYNTARGDFDAEATFEDGQFKLDGTIRHPDLKPLKVEVKAPIELKPILEGKMPDVQTIPFTASVEMPSSSLGVLPKLTPAIARADGTIAISMQATGTIAEPKLSGEIRADAQSIRLTNRSIPPISEFTARITLSGDTVTVQRLSGVTGGGRFGVSGTIVAENLLEPVVDLRVQTDKVLAVRNDSVLVRVDADVSLKGPYNAGTASGRVVLAQSRFNKEIQILPMIMPGRPKPVPREVAQPTEISFPEPPLRDWKFDIAIVTTNDDPFLVRGNLAKGQVIVDLRLLGTGEEPYLIGAASMEQFSAQLPVSRLTTRRGLIQFSRENPFEPRLEIESETVIRGYTIIARLEGPASAPRLDLSSEPPLPQQEIMTLITTGSLSGELGENSTALATRAGMMVLRDLYKKIFKRDLPVPTDEGGDNFFARLDVDIGAVDSRTGRQEITAKYRVTDHVFIIADVEMDGGISGRIQYQFRFR